MKVALVAYARHENQYMKEWIDYYASIGVDHIFIGDNNDAENDEDILSFVDSLGYSDFVSVFDRKNKADEKNFNIKRQDNFYNEIYKQYGNEYDWMAFYDIDEYLNIFHSFIPNNNIKDYIQACVNNAIKSGVNENDITDIRTSWLIYSDNNHIFYEDKPVQERFTEITDKIYDSPFNWLNYICKMILKTNKDVEIHTHYPQSINANYTILSLYNGGYDHVMNRPVNTCDFVKNDAVVKHFFSKSLEEFLQRRIFDKKSHNVGDQSATFDSIVEGYFNVNKKTVEKEKVVELYRKLYENNLI